MRNLAKASTGTAFIMDGLDFHLLEIIDKVKRKRIQNNKIVCEINVTARKHNPLFLILYISFTFKISLFNIWHMKD